MRILRKRIWGRATLGDLLATLEIRLALLALVLLAAVVVIKSCVQAW